jgi:3-hydroxyisobutyrate dehydrogenase
VTAEGRSWKFPLFLSSVSEQLYLLGARMGFGYEDDSGVVRTFSPREPSTVALSKLKPQNPSTTGYEDILLIHELLETVHTAAAVEALALGMKMGLPATDLVPIIASAAGSSESFRTMADKILAGDFSTGKTITEGCTKLVSWFVLRPQCDRY